MNHPQSVTRAVTGHRWPALLALLAAALALGAAAPQRASAAAADLVLTVTDTPDPAVRSDTLTITATVGNMGNAAAIDPYVNFTPPSDAKVLTYGNCFNVIIVSCPTGTPQPGTDTREFAPGASATFSITLSLADVTSPAVEVPVNTTHNNDDTDPPPNSVTSVTRVEDRADLKLELSAITPVTIGNTSTVTATITNSLPGPARETKLQLTVPPELPVAALPPDCTAVTALKVICDLGTIEGQGTASRAITLRVPNEGGYILLGSVAWAKADPTPIDAQGQITITGLSPIEPTDPGPPQYPADKPVLPKPQRVPIGLFTRDVPTGRRCIRTRTLRFRLKRPSGVPLTQADVYVGTRRVKRLTGAALTKPVVLTKLPRGRYTLIVVASLRDGGRLSGRRALKSCR